MKENNQKEESRKSSVVYGLYTGVIIGAIVMTVAGGLGYKTVADLSLVMGICAGPSIGWIIEKYKKKKETKQE